MADAIFSDEEITALFSLEGSSLKRTAALALETIAANEALTTKAIRILELSMDGPAVARSLLDRALRLRTYADAEDAQEGAGAFDIAEWTVNDFAAREIETNIALRGG
jgi:hypothetical protein